MRIEPGVGRYEARFTHLPYEEPVRMFGRSATRAVVGETLCTLSALSEAGESFGFEAWQGKSWRSASEPADRQEKGEAVALRRALELSDVPRPEWPAFFAALARRHRGRRLDAVQADVLARLRGEMLAGRVGVVPVLKLISDARAAMPARQEERR